MHGARGDVHDAARRPLRDLQALPAAARAGGHGDEEHGRDDEAGGGSGGSRAAPAEARSGRDRHAPGAADRLPARRRGRSRRRTRLGCADRDPRDEPLPPARDRIRKQLRGLQGAGGALRGARQVLRLRARGADAERAGRVTTARGAVAAGGRGLDVYLESAGERRCLQVVARARRAGRGYLEGVQVPRLGARQQSVERVSRVPALRAQEAGGAGCRAARRLRVRRRRLTCVGDRARRLEQPRVARAPRAVRGRVDRGG